MIRAGVARPGEDSPARLGAGTHITVALIPTVVKDLGRLQQRTKLSTTDLVNRAITSYEFFDAQMREGRHVLVRNKSTGETQLVRFM